MINGNLGQYDKALAASVESQRLEPDAIGYSNLAGTYLALDGLDDWQKATSNMPSSARSRAISCISESTDWLS